MLRVLLCDDARAFPVLMAHWMNDCDGVELVASTDLPDEAQRLAREHQPDVIVLDHMLQSVTSRELVPELRAAAPGARILLISSLAPDLLEKAATEGDLDGHISKASSPQEICEAILNLA